MASVHSKPGAKGKTLWYASIYLDGAPRQFPLFENDGRTRPVDRNRALKLAGNLERQLKQGNPKTKLKATRNARFITVWPLFSATIVSQKATNTQNDYKWAFDGHFKTARFAKKRVGLITHTDIQAYVDSKKGALSPHTLNNHTGMLAQFFDFAKQNGYWDGPINPARAMGIRQPLTANPTIYLSRPEHGVLLIDAFDPVRDEKYAVLTATLLWTGIRWSEARSLLWSQCSIDDPKHSHLRITTTAVGNDIQPHPKSKAGDRWVGLCPTLVKMLKHWRGNSVQGGTMGQERQRLGIDPSDGLVWPSDAGTILSPGNFRKPDRQFDRAKRAANAKDPSFPLNLPVHGLRHSHSMLLQREGINPIQLAHTMGHSKRAMLGSSATYTHAEAERENPIVAAMVEKSIKDARKALAKQRSGKGGTTAAAVPAPVVKAVARKSPKAAAAATAAKKAATHAQATSAKRRPKTGPAKLGRGTASGKP